MIFRLSAAARANTRTQGRARRQEASETACACVWAGMCECWRGCEQCAQEVQIVLVEGCMLGCVALGLRGGGCQSADVQEGKRR